MVETDTINTFKNRLDEHRINQEVLFYYNANVTVTGVLPICIWMYDCQDEGIEEYLCPLELTGLDWMHVLLHAFTEKDALSVL